jgi:hypothetical protein
VLHLRLSAGKVGLDDLRPFTGPNLPVAGSLDAQLQVDGPIHALGGSGWVEMDKGSVYGEPVTIASARRAHRQPGHHPDLDCGERRGRQDCGYRQLRPRSHRFQLDASGAGIDVARIESSAPQGLAVTGKLGFTVRARERSTTRDLKLHATLAGLDLSGEPLGALELVAHTANRVVTYDLTTRLEAAELHRARPDGAHRRLPHPGQTRIFALQH